MKILLEYITGKGYMYVFSNYYLDYYKKREINTFKNIYIYITIKLDALSQASAIFLLNFQKLENLQTQIG